MKELVRRQFLLGMAGGVAALVWPATVGAAPRVEADPHNNYEITPEAGPWVIMCNCFNGPYAAELGHEVVMWLREKQNLQAFVFDKGRLEREQQERAIEEQKRADPYTRIHRVKIEEQCTVLIGGFKDQETATDVLRRKVRQLPLPQSKFDPNLVLPFDISIQEKDGRQVGFPINPFAKAMVVPNPTVPLTKQAQKVDPFLKELNASEPYSLLKNQAPWTLLVREFSGSCAFQIDGGQRGDFMDQLPFAPHQNTKTNALEVAALSAEGAAKWLQKGDYEPYVLHTRQSSLVTVGGFDGPADPRMTALSERLSRDTRFVKLQMLQPMLALEVPRP